MIINSLRPLCRLRYATKKNNVGPNFENCGNPLSKFVNKSSLRQKIVKI